MLILRLLLLVVLAPIALLARMLGVTRRDMIALPDDHPEMATAIREAQESLPEFRRLLRSPEPGMNYFAVKVRFPTPQGHEHCWVNELELRESGLVGKLGNHPDSLPDLELGSTVEVAPDAITDWSYSKDGSTRVTSRRRS